MSYNASDLLFLVQEHGESITLEKNTTGTYDPSTGTATVTNVDYTVTGYYYDDVTKPLETSDVWFGTRMCVIPALGLAVEPDNEDRLSGGSDGEYYIHSVTKLFSAGTPVCYLCGVKR
tara:strand:+ start:43 stop:396 length:354 start_codon:yes stop_codon:yes gene_type:complete